jgi:hypothetical protein
VRTFAGSIGTVLAMPITTAIATLLVRHSSTVPGRLEGQTAVRNARRWPSGNMLASTPRREDDQAMSDQQDFSVEFHLLTGEVVRTRVKFDDALSGTLGFVGAIEAHGDYPTERHRAMARLTASVMSDLERATSTVNIIDTAGAVWIVRPESIGAVSITDPQTPETARVVSAGFRPPGH